MEWSVVLYCALIALRNQGSSWGYEPKVPCLASESRVGSAATLLGFLSSFLIVNSEFRPDPVFIRDGGIFRVSLYSTGCAAIQYSLIKNNQCIAYKLNEF